jgi:glycosyltransferase involved in cell wall biosynthesis
MKVLLVWRLCGVGGVEAWMVELAQAYRALGNCCELFFFHRGAFEKQIPSDLKVHFGDLADLIQLVRSEGFDIVHSSTMDWEYGVTAVRHVGARLIVTGHGHVRPAWNSTNCDGIIACSRWNADAQQSTADIPVRVVYNGIDTSRFHPPKTFGCGQPIVAWVGRGGDLQQKRIDRLAAIAPHLHRANIRLWIADPDGPAVVPAEIADALKPIAEYWGPVARGEMPEYFRTVAGSGGCVLSTSAFEGFSLAYIEAQASACPVIGPNVRGVNEGVDPQWGGVIYDPDAPADTVARLVLDTLRDKEGMSRRRRACRKFVEQSLTIETMVRQYLRIYEEVLASPPESNLRWYARLFRSPRKWLDKAFLYEHWVPGHHQFLASQTLSGTGHLRSARAAVLSSLQTCPSLYLRPTRLAHLVKAVWNGTFLTESRPRPRSAAGRERADGRQPVFSRPAIAHSNLGGPHG